jgi:tetratricopeptide (TPR) repeat protein
LEQLEQRILELEHSAHPSAIPTPTVPPHATANGNPRESKSNGNPRTLDDAAAAVATSAFAPTGPGTVAGAGPSHAEIQLGKGQALLNLEQPAEALECFESALAEEPNNTEALLRKGMTLEKLEQWDRALECYDRAIELDGSLTVAYLYKGGICNRLEKHDEALRSYERALQSERQRAVSER